VENQDLEEQMSNSNFSATTTSSSNKIVAFFNDRFTEKLEFAANDYDSVVNFFQKRGFGKPASQALAQVLLSEAKKEGLKIFELLDTIKGLNKLQLNSIILKILNESRHKVSQLGFRTNTRAGSYEERNILDSITDSDEYKYLEITNVSDIKNITVATEYQGNILLRD
jgi:hypothetical protein